MDKIRIVTDSTADLPEEIVNKYKIKVIPLSFIIDGKVYHDLVDISREQYYQELINCKEFPTTSQPTPAEFLEAYNELIAEGAEQIISIHLSGDLSGTVKGAQMTAQMVKNAEVCVIDSRTATMGLGLIVLETAKAVAAGADFTEAVRVANQAVDKSDLFFLLDSLDNLQKGGRIGKAGYLVGSLLNIKPVLRLHEGEIHAFDKVRGNRENKAMEKMVEDILHHIDPDKKVYCAVGYCDNINQARKMVELLKPHLICDEYVYMQIGNVVITHIGMGAVGLAFYQL